MTENYGVWDAMDCYFEWFKTPEEAEKYLNTILEEYRKEGECPEELEDFFIFEKTHELILGDYLIENEEITSIDLKISKIKKETEYGV
ncbi:hypothetical protein F1737_08950 [Methanoplanus sp. FWC-SCC4]|uniref:Uncharacterized protein n=1 Tax=Methanochimaera problematica TaxID=2609417 RepID=A0AA97FD10_9EURY|nr:hypothetical protein [Methanoplanus sp. FWC-SCC4]WOF16807.1 hypothetical protein F1737_08950 [Methanoplanus sp. FWC-SCC4]